MKQISVDVFDCPVCGGPFKQLDKNPFQLSEREDRHFTPYGCANCGYVGIFVTKFLEDYKDRLDGK